MRQSTKPRFSGMKAHHSRSRPSQVAAAKGAAMDLRPNFRRLSPFIAQLLTPPTSCHHHRQCNFNNSASTPVRPPQTRYVPHPMLTSTWATTWASKRYRSRKPVDDSLPTTWRHHRHTTPSQRQPVQCTVPRPSQSHHRPEHLLSGTR